MLIDSRKKSQYYKRKDNYQLKISSFLPGYLNQKRNHRKNHLPHLEPAVNSLKGDENSPHDNTQEDSLNPERGGNKFKLFGGSF